MVQGVYVDILLSINFAIHILLLSLLGKLSRKPLNPRRMVWASLAGALFSLTVFLPPLGRLGELFLKIGSTSVILLLAFPWQGIRGFVQKVFLLFTLGSLFSGILSALQNCWKLSGLFVFDRAVYFHVKTSAFIFCLGGSYAVVWVLNRILDRVCPAGELYQVKIKIGGKESELLGFMDTGNSLREPFSSLPVVLCSLDTGAKILPESMLEAVLGMENEFQCRVRQIPFSTAAGRGMIPGVRGEEMVVWEKDRGKVFCCHNFYLAVTEENVGEGNWQLLLNPGILGESFVSQDERTGALK